MTNTTHPTLGGRTIVLTRQSPGSLAEHLRALGATVAHVPLIARGKPSDGGAALRAALSDLATFDWVVVTSANGAAAVGSAVAGHPVRLAAVGPATASTLSSLAGRGVDLVPAVASAEGLLAEFPPAPSRILIALADLAGDRLANRLRSGGHEVVAVEAYATVKRRPEPGELERLRRADAVVLASGSAAQAWHEAVLATGDAWPAGPARVVTIGPRTAEMATSVGLPVAAVASAPNDGAVIDALADALGAA